MTDVEKRERFAARYAAEKQMGIESGTSGSLYRRNLVRRRRRKMARIKQILKITAAVGILVLLIFLISLVVKGIAGLVSKESEAAVADAEEPAVQGIQVTIEPAEDNKELSEEDVSEDVPSTVPTDAPDLANIPATATYRGLVIIDAGHGGNDGGACIGSVTEKELNLKVAFKIKDELEGYGYEVYMTREDDTFVGIKKRASLANEQEDAQLFVSIHMNAIEDAPSVNGIEVWSYDRTGSKELAAHLMEQTAAATGANNRGVSYSKGLVVIRDTKIPACLIECGYLTNEKEKELLQTEEYQKKLVNGIVTGIDLYLSEQQD